MWSPASVYPSVATENQLWICQMWSEAMVWVPQILLSTSSALIGWQNLLGSHWSAVRVQATTLLFFAVWSRAQHACTECKSALWILADETDATLQQVRPLGDSAGPQGETWQIVEMEEHCKRLKDICKKSCFWAMRSIQGKLLLRLLLICSCARAEDPVSKVSNWYYLSITLPFLARDFIQTHVLAVWQNSYY